MQFSIVDLWLATGPVGRLVVLTLLAMSIASISVGTERLLALRRARRLSAEFLAAWRDREERPWSGAVDVAPGPADASPAAILLRGLGNILDQGMPQEIAEKAYDRTTRRLLLASSAQLRRGLGFLATVGSTAPFIGLFGTVLGIVNAFAQMASTGQGGLAVVAGGIAEALVTTALGILAAIPALWMYNSLSGGIVALMTEIECAAEELAVSALGAEYAAPLPTPRLVRRAAGGRSDAR
ncbi:MotA/TolQ/ExbB proton channel family protein [Candidatus Binatia bacterium]|nr:MotA/TolQ/ExbB proton channel family protein [Candidatus Binatia bacterium]